MRDEPQDVATGVIVDNQDLHVGDFLYDRIGKDSNLSIVSAYFTIYAYEALRDVLDHAGEVRFLYGEPRGVGVMDPRSEQTRSFLLNSDSGIELRHVLAQKALAKACAAWIESKVEIKSIKQAGFLHGKLYHIADEDGDAALLGSSNFTRRGLGYGEIPNIELNIEIRNEADRHSITDWFNDLWTNQTLTEDVKAEVLTALGRLGAPYSPEFVYYKTLFHVFADWIARQDDRDELLHDIHLHDTAVWQALYDFQRHGAVSAINRLLRHNGCILADSVGLGKTWTALAVIKFFELRNERVLVLCPKRIEANWTRYASWAGQRNNPLEKDRLNYTVLAHTDLSRYQGKSGLIDLDNFNWGGFDLVVIDESHNFRNEGRNRSDEAGNLIRLSRYNRLLEEVIKDGARTKLLMLSATPVNTSLRDLRNQIYLMTEKRRDAFQKALGIGDLQTLFGVAQREFQNWEKARRNGGLANKSALVERLGADFLTLLDAVTIARSRNHLRRYYTALTQQIGGFPKRAQPENLYPPTDSEGEFSYDELNQQINTFGLAVYTPSQYVKNTADLDAEKATLHFDQRDREHWLIGMMRVNLLKRLESSVYAFTLTVRRILDRMEQLEGKIEAWERHERSSELIDFQPEEDEEDDDFTVGKGRTYRLDELELSKWREHLRADRELFDKLHQQAQKITFERDAKLAELKKLLLHKVTNAPLDKDGLSNRKALVFTSFADTARYLYDHLEDWVLDESDVHMALVTGGSDNRSTLRITKFNDILGHFSPKAQNYDVDQGEIDILIATDCLSEGQNLQDCDLVINYDIHWNPVRLLQRFGRIDRLGSRSQEVRMINFWPTQDLDRYLDLRNRVEARMALVDATATGDDDPLSKDATLIEDAARRDLAFRDEQLRRIRDEVLDAEDTDDAVTMSDLTLDDFLADLMQYMQRNRARLEEAPFGIYAIAPPRPEMNRSGQTTPQTIQPGVIFCLKHKGEPAERTPNRLWPYFLVHVRNDKTVRYTFLQARQCLALFRELAGDRPQIATTLENAFDQETWHGQRMKKYDMLLANALRDINKTFRSAQLDALILDRGATLARQQPNSSETFELITWFIIADEDTMTDDGTTDDA